MIRSEYLMLKTWLVIGQVIKECESVILESFSGLIKDNKIVYVDHIGPRGEVSKGGT